jgi:hypothetical protein
LSGPDHFGGERRGGDIQGPLQDRPSPIDFAEHALSLHVVKFQVAQATSHIDGLELGHGDTLGVRGHQQDGYSVLTAATSSGSDRKTVCDVRIGYKELLTTKHII